MGYTHYWKRPAKLPAKKFAVASATCKAACELLTKQTGIPIVQEFNNNDPPTFSEDTVWFNGKGEDGHESFVIQRQDMDYERDKKPTPAKGEQFAFCKTVRKPYDIHIAVCLVIFEKVFGPKVFKISSDDREEGFTEARKFVEQLV